MASDLSSLQLFLNLLFCGQIYENFNFLDIVTDSSLATSWSTLGISFLYAVSIFFSLYLKFFFNFCAEWILLVFCYSFWVICSFFIFSIHAGMLKVTKGSMPNRWKQLYLLFQSLDIWAHWWKVLTISSVTCLGGICNCIWHFLWKCAQCIWWIILFKISAVWLMLALHHY